MPQISRVAVFFSISSCTTTLVRIMGDEPYVGSPPLPFVTLDLASLAARARTRKRDDTVRP